MLAVRTIRYASLAKLTQDPRKADCDTSLLLPIVQGGIVIKGKIYHIFSFPIPRSNGCLREVAAPSAQRAFSLAYENNCP